MDAGGLPMYQDVRRLQDGIREEHELQGRLGLVVQEGRVLGEKQLALYWGEAVRKPRDILTRST